MRTGILGGTFDPIHVAHLHTAETALHQLSLDRVLLIPAGDPWQKSDRVVTDARHRVRMCELAVSGVDGLEVDVSEVERQGPTYTIDTLESFDAAEELFLIVGSDAAAGLETWHRWPEVVSRAAMVIAPRPGSPPPDLVDARPLEMGLLEISGTDIRDRVRRSAPYRYLVTKEVHSYIETHTLYADRDEGDIVDVHESLESSS